MNDLSAIQEH